VCCSVLQCVAVCCSALQCVAVCCSMLQCGAVCCSVLQCVAVFAVCCSVLQCVAVCCSILQHVAVRCSVLQCSDLFVSDITLCLFCVHESPPTRWRTPIGCLKLRAIFCKRATNTRALLQTKTYIDKISNGSSPSSTLMCTQNLKCS